VILTPPGPELVTLASHLIMDCVVTRVAEARQIIKIICTALGQRHLVMHLFNRNKASFFLTQLTEGVSVNIDTSYLSPRLAVSLIGFRVPSITVVLPVGKGLVLITVCSFAEVRAAAVTTRRQRFPRHCFHHLFKQYKRPSEARCSEGPFILISQL